MQYDLVFEGGGAKGLVFVGALQEFEAKGCTGKRFVGTSAGAITATLVAAGYNAAELLAASNEKLPNGKPVFSSFMDIPDKNEFASKDIEESLTYTIFKNIDLPGIPGWVEKRLDQLIFQQFMRLRVYRELFSFVERGGLYGGEAFRHWMALSIK